MKNIIQCFHFVFFQEVNMKKTKSVLTFIYFFICFSIFFTQTAYAYVDPATTAMVVQIVSGIFISLGIAFGVFRGKGVESKICRHCGFTLCSVPAMIASRHPAEMEFYFLTQPEDRSFLLYFRYIQIPFTSKCYTNIKSARNSCSLDASKLMK